MADDVGNLHHEGLAANVGEHAQMVAEKRHVAHFDLELVGVHAGLGGEASAFRAHGKHHLVAHRVRLHHERVDRQAANGHVAGVAVHGGHHAAEQVVVADEGRHERALRFFVQHFRRGDLLDAPAVEHRHAVGHGHRLLLIMGHVDHGHAQGALNAAYFELHLLAQPPVERAERLVHEHKPRLEHECPRDRHALLLATGKLPGAPVLEALQPHQLQGARNPLGHRVFVQSPHLEGKRQIGAHRHVRKQRVVLEHHADVAAARGHGVHRLAVDADGTAGRHLEAGQHHQAGGLAGAGGSEQRQKLPFVYGEVEVANDLRDPVVALGHAVELHIGVRAMRGLVFVFLPSLLCHAAPFAKLPFIHWGVPSPRAAAATRPPA